MYLSVPGPPSPPPPSWACKSLKVGCPAPVPTNPDNLAGLYAGLQTEIPVATTPLGLGCAGSGCQCGGKCQGMGLFDSGTDFSGWGISEWLVIGIGVFSVFTVASRGARSAAELTTKKGRRRRSRRKRLMETSGLFG
jgi:hypothetical protein